MAHDLTVGVDGHDRPAVGGLLQLLVVAAAVVGFAGATVLAAPLIAVVAGAVLCVVLAVLRPKATVGVAVLAILLTPTLEKLTGWSRAGLLDDGATVLCVSVLPLARLFSGSRLRRVPGGRCFAGFAVLGVLSGVLRGVDSQLLLLGGFLSCKGILFGYACAQVDWSCRDVARTVRLGKVLLLALLACAAANLVAPVAWTSVFQRTDYLDYRYGLPSLIGPFVHPADFGQIAALAAIAALAYVEIVSRSVSAKLTAAALVLAACFSFRRKTQVGLVLVVAYRQARLSRGRLLVVAVLVAPLVLLAAGTFLSTFHSTYQDYVVEGSGAARTVLTRGAFSVAHDYFPFGAGFSRFGSYLAGVHYSPEYVSRGYPSIYGLGQEAPNNTFLTDTQWPAIVGEAGVVGAVLFLAGLGAVYRQARSASRVALAQVWVRWLAAVTLGWLLQLLVESTAAPVFTAPPTAPLLFVASGVLTALLAHPESTEEPQPEMVLTPAVSSGTLR